MTSASSITKPLVVGRGQARRLADGAVDVGDRAAGAAHDVVVVVADPAPRSAPPSRSGWILPDQPGRR